MFDGFYTNQSANNSKKPLLKKEQHFPLGDIQSLRISFLALVCLFMNSTFSQNTLTDTVQERKRITFSTIPNTKQKSLETYFDALKNTTYGVQRFSVIDQLAAYHIDQANTDSILYYGHLYQKEIELWDTSVERKSHNYSNAYYILGVGNRYNGLIDNSIKWHINGITNGEKGNNPEGIYRNKIGLAKIYILKETYDRAISVLEDVLLAYEDEFPAITNDALICLGDANFRLKEYSEAKSNYEKAIEGARNFGDLAQELEVNLKLGRLAESEGDYNRAFDLYNETREKGLDSGITVFYFEGTIRVAHLFFKEKNYDAATAALSVAYVNAIERENLNYQKEVLDVQRRTFAATGDYQNAYAVMTQLDGVTEQIRAQQQQRINREIEVQYETLQKEKEIASLQEDQISKAAELKRQKTIKTAFLIGFLIILIPIMALLYLYYQKLQAQSQLAKKQEEINEQKVTALKQEQQLNLIKASIEGQDEERKRIAQELHDSIGGNLAGIKLQLSSLTKGAKKYQTISGQIDETYQLVRDISHTLIPSKFKENAFTGLIREYVKSMSRSGELQIGFHPHPEERLNQIPKKTQMELFKIIQELMTNTLKHANASKVDIHLSLIGDELSLLFEDNGQGFEVSQSTKGIGIENIKNRISELSGKLHIDSSEKRGTVISVELPNAKNIES